MSPAAGGAVPGQSSAATVIAPAITGQEPDRAVARRDPPGQVEGADLANAAARKTAWGVPAPTPAAAAAAVATNPGGGIIGGDASWPALVESKRGKTASSNSLKSLYDGSGPSAQEDPVAASAPSHPVVEAKPISSSSNPTPAPPPNAAASASLQQNGSTTKLNPVWRSRSRRAVNSSGSGGSRGSRGDSNWNGGSLGSGSSCNSSNGDGGGNLNDNVPGSNTSGNGNESSRNAFGNNIRRVDSRSSNVSGDGNTRNSGGSSNHWNNNFRNSNGISNGAQGRSGYRSRRDHERGGNFSPRNYPQVSVTPYHQQHPGAYQPGSFNQPPPPIAGHFMAPQQFVTYAPPFSYHVDVSSYPLYLPPVEQFQNMNIVRTPMQSSWILQDQSNLQEDIKMQIEFYFSTNNLCHDTFLRRHMDDQGWVSIDLILGFNRMRAFTGLVDTNYILDAIRGSESLEVQGNNVRRRNDWAEWLLH